MILWSPERCRSPLAGADSSPEVEGPVVILRELRPASLTAWKGSLDGSLDRLLHELLQVATRVLLLLSPRPPRIVGFGGHPVEARGRSRWA